MYCNSDQDTPGITGYYLKYPVSKMYCNSDPETYLL